MLDRAVIDSLFPADLPEAEQWEQRYPARDLPEGAKVTRLGPSPTGFVHIGTVYVATIDRDVASNSGGVYLVRVEDTDQTRLVDSAIEQFDRAFSYFGIASDEDTEHGDYGPYQQSEREQIYLSFVRELLRQDKAYLCFATKEELADITERQRATKLPTGYYGRWAIWRDADPADVQAKLDEGAPYVVRFRAPDGSDSRRVSFVDAIRGELSADDNRNDAVILKSSDQSPRLPTYHFAHAVDDHLMRVNTVIRGDEWISSVPLHLQLFEALGFEQPTYAHIAPLLKLIPGGKRKLSKRKDDEANVDWYMSVGYPAEAVSYYLKGLANGKLAELPLADALATPISLADCGVAGPLVDLDKLTDISADFIGTLDSPTVLERLKVWAREYDAEVAELLEQQADLALRALAVERDGSDNPRKDLRMWSDFRPAYGFFFSSLFELVNGPGDQRLVDLGVPVEVITAFAADLVNGYQQLDDPQEWFGQIRELAAKHGFAKNAKEYKKNPDDYPGSIREASQIVRIALTGSTRSPDMHAITQVLGADEVLRRLRPLTEG
ncbi:glutamate--tRNA ligase [Microlunatus soli]|uniref:Glutamyl-tRNA synthetase n=1 Tax=Microlunatus soli TaxID=630515 RepID=A0A1H1UCR4_9ACTN|nr:glutamate--tRNA ligase family protein [Microlunatus soli]SDS70305.1 glutamyl-tRNA synthetase [Microlunatus soli]